MHGQAIEERFWPKVNKTATCWLWTGAVNSTGYPLIGSNRRVVCAHRVSYELAVGPIPDGYEVDHTCRVLRCVNPAHLEPVTPRENTLRSTGMPAVWAKREVCDKGHPFTEENTYVRRSEGRARRCRICKRARDNARREARR